MSSFVVRGLAVVTVASLLVLVAATMPSPTGAQPPEPPATSIHPSPFHHEPWTEASPFEARALSIDQAPTLCAVEDGQDPYDVVDTFFTQEVDRYGFPGAAMAVARDGVVTFERGYGLKHREEGGEVDAQTQFRFGSALKMMTAAAVMQQVEAGQVALDASVTTYVPEFALAEPDAAEAISVWNLLTHSSGIPDSYGPEGLVLDGPKTPEALSEWAASLGEMKTFAPAGSFWNYSNPNFSMAGLVVERASGVSYHDYMATEIFARAGMTSTTLLPADVMNRGNYTFGHTLDRDTGEPYIPAPDAYDNWVVTPAGYGFTTASDLVRWASLLMAGGEDVLSPDSASEMQMMQVSQDTIPGVGYGYGIMTEPFGDVELRHHGGNVPGWGAYLLWVPEYDFAVATLNNTDGNLTRPLVCAIEAVLGLPLPEGVDYSTDPATWGRYAGSYEVVDVIFSRLGMAESDEFNAEVTHHDAELRVAFDGVGEMLDPTIPFSRTLYQTALDTFAMDINLDGRPDGTWSVTFIDEPETEGDVEWMRNRFFVGTRAEPRTPSVYLPALVK